MLAVAVNRLEFLGALTKGFNTTQDLTVDFDGLAGELLRRAKELDPNNPALVNAQQMYDAAAPYRMSSEELAGKRRKALEEQEASLGRVTDKRSLLQQLPYVAANAYRVGETKKAARW